MSLKYSLIPNHLTDDPDDYMAVVQDQRTRTREDIINEMLERGSTVTRADILSVFEEEQAVVKKFLADGDRVQTDLYSTSSSIAGPFNGAGDSFDASRNHVRFNMTPNRELVALAREVDVKKIAASVVRPVLESFFDFVSGTRNQALTPGRSAEIRGSHLKVDPEDPVQGIWFIASDGTETQVELVTRNMPAHLMFEVPAGLAGGEYQVEVRNKPRGANELRTGRLMAPLVAT